MRHLFTIVTILDADVGVVASINHLANDAQTSMKIASPPAALTLT